MVASMFRNRICMQQMRRLRVQFFSWGKEDGSDNVWKPCTKLYTT
jgi:hypothetical protein